MFNLGLFELVLFGTIALIVLGPDKLLEAARALGRWYAFFKNAKERLQNEVISELQLLETQAELKKELANLKQTESELKSQMQALKQSVEQNHQAIINELNNHTTPMTGQFFLLGEYDKKRRLPNAPFLPNHRPDTLLNLNG